MEDSEFMRGLRALFQIIAGFLSWMLHLVVRTLMRILSALHAWRKIDDRRWRLFSQSMLSQPLALPVILTSAPRWNPHAVIATAGPVRIRESLTFDRAVADRSASSWSLSVYSFPLHRLAASLGTLYKEKPEDLRLVPGSYLLAWRYQSVVTDAEIPAITIDGRPQIETCRIDHDVKRFYDRLAERSTLFLKALNYYVYVMLRFRDWLPKAWVRSEYVPVGSADTEFLMGAVDVDERITVSVPAGDLKTHEVTLTQYDLASLPTFWTRIECEDYCTAEARVAGHYLIRIRRKAGTDGEAACAARATVTRAHATAGQTINGFSSNRP
jgi:hypothetical protein